MKRKNRSPTKYECHGIESPIMKTIGISHIGVKRKKNEDRYLINHMHDGSILLAVADGMGGEVAGDYAAEIAINKLASMQFGDVDVDKKRHLAFLVKQADRAINDEVENSSPLEGMGTTVTSVLIDNKTAHWVHVGDSRLYLLRNQGLIQLTKDENMAQFLLDEGEITEEEAHTHPMRNLLEQFVGSGECEPASGESEIMVGDSFILATDGLYVNIAADTILSILTQSADIETKAKFLVQRALDAGGKDNITVVIAEM